MTAGLVVMAYGTPSSPDAVASYYTHIRRGRPPTDEQLADLQARYEAIGGVSPLAARTQDQAQAIATGLESLAHGGWRVALGNKHAPPFVEDAVTELLTADQPLDRIVGLVLAPHYSRGSVAEYHARAAAAAGDVPYVGIDSWSDEPAWVDAQAARVRAALAELPDATRVLFTAHSLPERILADDPYPGQLESSADAIAAVAGVTDWGLAWQSAGRTPEPWRGPDILDVLRELAGTDRVDGVLVCPQGFVSDHLEVLYDLDVQAAELAGSLGLAFARTASINDEPAVMNALAHKVAAA